VNNLSEILQMTSKAGFSMFMRKSQENTKKNQEIKENIQKFEKDRQKIEEKILQYESRYNNALSENKKLTS
jgi:cytochrome c556